jgi:hypothetical protein
MGGNIFMFATGVHFSFGVTSRAKLAFSETLRVLSPASSEVKGVTYFEIAPIVEVCCG